METKQEIVIIDTLTITTIMQMDAYGEFTPAEARDYEQNMERESILDAFVAAIEDGNGHDLNLGRTVFIQDVYFNG